MPTARELLEQADALMRRNRAAVDDDIPILTDAVPSALEAKSHFAPPSPPAVAPDDAFDDSGDVPLLTDEVEEIDAQAIDASVDEGEPSVWLDFDEAEPSVIGDAPDSIAIVPPVDVRRQAPAPEVDEFDELDDELAAAVAAAPPEEEALLPAPSPAPAPEIVAPVSPSLFRPSLFRETPVIAGGAAALLHGDDEAMLASPVPVAAVADPVEPAPAVAPLAAPIEPVPPPVPDAAHWEAMAEEIRMQVLQRIDLFTDTGLRTQLGARLQPIVDRASADLVATINQHVGELLRAYVAEAIEREIDSWRRNH
jgi:hypothetical protein